MPSPCHHSSARVPCCCRCRPNRGGFAGIVDNAAPQSISVGSQQQQHVSPDMSQRAMLARLRAALFFARLHFGFGAFSLNDNPDKKKEKFQPDANPFLPGHRVARTGSGAGTAPRHDRCLLQSQSHGLSRQPDQRPQRPFKTVMTSASLGPMERCPSDGGSPYWHRAIVQPGCNWYVAELVHRAIVDEHQHLFIRLQPMFRDRDIWIGLGQDPRLEDRRAICW